MIPAAGTRVTRSRWRRSAGVAAVLSLAAGVAMSPSSLAAGKAKKTTKKKKKTTTRVNSTAALPTATTTTVSATTTTAVVTTTTIPFVPSEEVLLTMKRFGITLADVQTLFTPTRMTATGSDTNFQLRADVGSNFGTNALNLGCNKTPALTGNPTLPLNAILFRGGIVRITPIRVQGEFNTTKAVFPVCNITLDFTVPKENVQAVVEAFLTKIADNAA